MNKNFKLLIVFVFLFSFLILPNLVQAAGFLDEVGCIATDQNGQCVQWNNCMSQGDCGFGDIEQGFIALTKWLIGGIGALALLYFVWGGIQWLTSYGNQQKIQKGREIMLQTVIALVIAFMSYILVEFFVNDVLRAKQEVQVNTDTRYEEINIVPSTMYCCFKNSPVASCELHTSCAEGEDNLGPGPCSSYPDKCLPALPE